MVLMIRNANIISYKDRFHNMCNAHQPGKPLCSLSLRSMMSDMLGMASAFSFDSSSAAVEDEVSDNDKSSVILINTYLCQYWKQSSTLCAHNAIHCHLLVCGCNCMILYSYIGRTDFRVIVGLY